MGLKTAIIFRGTETAPRFNRPGQKTMRFGAYQILRAAWIVWALYWIVSAFRVRKMRKREPILQRLAHLIVVALALAFLFSSKNGVYLRARFEHARALRWLGTALAVAGLAFAIWARRHLGEYWSGIVGLREGHQLIRTGPYAHIRHPIYSGLLLALAGSALALGTYADLAVWGIVAAGLCLKAKREEKLLAEEFGAEFQEHRRHTGFLFPRFS